MSRSPLVLALHLCVASSSALLLGSRCSHHTRATPPRASVSTAPATIEVAKLFGRMSDAVLYLDPAVGACCHSACDDCEWRDPEGGYRFDMLKAVKNKWVCCYVHRNFEDERGRSAESAWRAHVPHVREVRFTKTRAVRCALFPRTLDQRLPPVFCRSHSPRWVTVLFPEGEASAPISRTEFDLRLGAAEFEMPMGPRGNIKAGEDELEPETLAVLWMYLADGAETLSVQEAVRRLQDMSLDENRDGAVGEGPDMLDWKAFAKGLGALPFEKW